MRFILVLLLFLCACATPVQDPTYTGLVNRIAETPNGAERERLVQQLVDRERAAVTVPARKPRPRAVFIPTPLPYVDWQRAITPDYGVRGPDLYPPGGGCITSPSPIGGVSTICY